ncbi:MAG: haloacid dehalogenase, partial [Rhizobacter sp.]
MIKAVFFDYDGVITLDKTGSLTTCCYLGQRLGLPTDTVQAAMRPHNEALNQGHTTHRAIWPEVCRALGRNIPFEWLQAAFESTPLNGEML